MKKSKFYWILFLMCLTVFVDTSAQQIPAYLECVKLNHLYRKASHNSYEAVDLTLEEVIDLTRVIELDIHSHKHGGNEANSGVWYVRHAQNTNNKNNCINKLNGSSNQDFGICLENVKDWSWANPGHDPIILFIDLKPPGLLSTTSGDFFRPNHSTTDLDNVFKQFAIDMGGLDMVYKPADLKGNFSSPREAAKNENWPSLGNLKNKFLFVLTGANSHLNEYLVNVGGGAMAFVAVKPDVTSTLASGYIPTFIQNHVKDQVVFYNVSDNILNISKDYTSNNGFISRSYPGQIDDNIYGNHIYNKINNIAMDNIRDNFPGRNMNQELTNIHQVTVGGTPTSPQYIKSQYNSILQSAIEKVTLQNLIVEAGTHYNIRAGEKVELLPGTILEAGSNVTISVGSCADYSAHLRPANNSNNITNTTDISSYNPQPKELNQENGTVINNHNLETIPEQPNIYPNPTTGIFNVNINRSDKYSSIKIYNTLGKQVFNQLISGNKLTINLTGQPKGIYLIKVTVGKNVFNQKIIYQ